MALRPYFGHPVFDEMESMIDRVFDRRFVGDFFQEPFTSGTRCPVDLIEQPNAYLIKADTPGMDKSDVTVNVHDNRLTLSGERKKEKREEKGGFTRYKRSDSSFSRCVQLPRNADTDQIEAKMEKGVLTVSVPKKQIKESEQPRRIEIK